jgi:hypothetical protein
MKETYTYRGHSIDLDLRGMTPERTRWTYFIDGRYCIQGTTDASTVEAVRSSALRLAHRSIDVLDAIGFGKGDPKSSHANDSGAASTSIDRVSQQSTAARVPCTEARRSVQGPRVR